MNAKISNAYTAILKEELKLAAGCTEPIAISYCAAYARKLLGEMPKKCEIYCSGNIIKNVKGVAVPRTGGLKGIEAAALAGMIGGDADRKLEVLTTLSDEDKEEIGRLMGTGLVHTKVLDTEHALHIIVKLQGSGGSNVSVEIIDSHTGLGEVEKDGQVLHMRDNYMVEQVGSKYRLLNIKDIIAYADAVILEDVRDVLKEQIENNHRIAQEGLTNDWGAEVGKTLINSEGNGLQTMAVAMAAAGCDARMNGCPMPVVINSGSGNQGLTVSLPVIVYARENGADEESLMRALCVSNLVAIHQKNYIGNLSAFCGAVCAAAGAVAGIAYLQGDSHEVIDQAIINTICNIGGMICDGAKSSCAGKIATALKSAFLGYELARRGHGFYNGEGIVKADVEKTIASVGRIAKEGMYATDREILKIMI